MVSTPDDIEMPDAESTEDDNLSLTSTIVDQVNSDEEWTAEGIIAEGRVDGIKHWLVEWTGYPIAEATWEPRTHVKGQLLRIWKKQKERQERGEVERFDLKVWRDALSDQLHAKEARHEKRNEKRKRLGLEPTTWEQSADEFLKQSLDYFPEFETRDQSSSDEAALSDEGDEGDSEEDDDAKNANGNEKDPDREKLDNTASNSSHLKSLSAAESDHDPTIEHLVPEFSEESQMISPLSFQPPNNEDALASAPELNSTLPPMSTSTLASNSTSGTPQKASPTPFPTSTSASSSTVSKMVSTQPSQHNSDNPTANAVGRPSKSSGSSNEKPTGFKSRLNKLITPTGGNTPVNVFAGGSTRKARPTLLDAAADTSKEPRLVNLRQQRLIQQGRRDKENNAPAQLPKRLISLDPNSPTGEINANHHTKPSEDSLPAKSKDSTEAPQNEPPLPSTDPPQPKENNEPTPQPKKPKRKKSVRFDDMITYQEPTYLEPEPDLFSIDNFRNSHASQEDQDISPLQDGGTNFRPPTPPRNTHITSPQPWTSSETRSVLKRCIFGSKSSKHLEMVFEGIPKQTSHSWLSEFMKCTHLVFGHMCIALDFRSQSYTLRQGSNFASGGLCCPTDQSAFENMTNRLGIASKGLMCYSERFCTLVFPAKCADWDFEPILNLNTGHLLKFVIFEPTPLMHKDSFARRNSQEIQALPRGLSHFLQLDSRRLIPHALSNSRNCPQHIFLAFPTPSRVQEARFIATWLRVSSKTELHIYSSSIPGDWHRFRETGNGTLIIHEDAISKIRLFPEMAEMLRETARNANYAIFIFQQALGQFYRFPSVLQRSQPGDIILCRILPSPKVFMMTPSFMVSQPQEACNFVRWFKNNLPTNGANYRTKLAVCSDITDWARHLAVEQARRKLVRPPRTHSLDIQSWMSLWHQLEELVADSMKESESDNFLLFAPDSIDGNDEQSLVNWFGSWTIKHLDTACRFFVLGSNCTQVPRMTREIKIPKYAPDVDNEQPDVAREMARDLASQLLGETMAQTGPVNIVQEPQGPPTGPRGALQLVENDGASAIKARLQFINQSYLNPMTLVYNRPIAYWHTDMPWRFGDMNSEFETFFNWFSYFNALKLDNRSRNTFLGFFYTVNSTWNPEESPAERDPPRSPPRRPWIAIFRTREPHKRPWRSTELLIWDPGYDKQFYDRPRLYERDLIEAQQELIKLVIKENRRKNPDLPLDKVWLGGRARCYNSPMNHPLDACLDTLEAFVKELKTWLPSPKEHMPSRGWRLVDDNTGPHEEIQPPRGEVSKAEPSQKLTMVFHPPPGRQTNRPSKCRNNLYRDAMRAELQPSSEGFFPFRFVPTHEWYNRQKEEDRGFSHINVEPWKQIFDMLQINEGDARNR